jgi:hypothetical protein
MSNRNRLDGFSGTGSNVSGIGSGSGRYGAAGMSAPKTCSSGAMLAMLPGGTRTGAVANATDGRASENAQSATVGTGAISTEGAAAIGAAFFLVRPHPRPKDLSYVTQRINQYALEQLRPRPVDEDCAEYERLATAGNQRRRSAQRQWRRLLHALVAYSQLGDDERNRVAWTQLVTIWQVNGRLLRGGQAATVYFCDAAFAPNTARRSGAEADLDDASTSLLFGMRDVLTVYFDPTSGDPDRHLVQALYQPLYQALTVMGDR